MILLVDNSPEQAEQMRNSVSRWPLKEVSSDTVCEARDPDATEHADAIIVFAHKDEEKHALEVCRQLRNLDTYNEVPLLVAITIYQMPLANAVKRLPNAHFVFTPIKDEELRDVLNDMSPSSSAVESGKTGK